MKKGDDFLKKEDVKAIIISDKIENLKETEKKLRTKLNNTELKILKSRLITLRELAINEEISALRAELEKNDGNKEEKYKIYNKINYLKKTRTKKEDLENMYKLRNNLIKDIEHISIKIFELTR